MPQFILICRDKADHFDLRAETRETHLNYVKSAGDAVLLAGPILDGEGRSIGSTLIIAADKLSDAQAFAENDPYALTGLFESIDVRPFRIVTGALVKSAAN